MLGLPRPFCLFGSSEVARVRSMSTQNSTTKFELGSTARTALRRGLGWALGLVLLSCLTLANPRSALGACGDYLHARGGIPMSHLMADASQSGAIPPAKSPGPCGGLGCQTPESPLAPLAPPRLPSHDSQEQLVPLRSQWEGSSDSMYWVIRDTREIPEVHLSSLWRPPRAV